TILYSTIAYNTANIAGGGIYQFQFSTRPIDIENTIIAKNSAPQGTDCFAAIAYSYYNIYSVLNPTECIIASSFFNITTDPKIDSNLSGLIGYHALLVDSPAI